MIEEVLKFFIDDVDGDTFIVVASLLYKVSVIGHKSGANKHSGKVSNVLNASTLATVETRETLCLVRD